MKTILFIELAGGRCGLSTDSRSDILRRLGTDNVSLIRPATEKDVAWVRGMGGDVPVGRIANQKREGAGK